MAAPRDTRRACHAGELHDARTQARLNIEDAAALCGVTLATYRRWESGQSPAPILAARLFRLMGGHLGDLHPAWDGWWLRSDGRLYDPALHHRHHHTPDGLRAQWWRLERLRTLEMELREARAELADMKKAQPSPAAPANDPVFGRLT